MLYTLDYLSYQTKSNTWEFIGMVFIFIPLIYKAFADKKEYLSELIITDSDISFVFKKRGKVTRTTVIDKSNIKSFVVDTNINLRKSGKYARFDVTYKFIVDLLNGEDINLKEIADIPVLESNYNFIYRLIDAADLIPNFELKTFSNSEYVKAEIDYYQRFRKKLPLLLSLKLQLKQMPVFSKIILIFCFIVVFICFGNIIYVSIPPFLSETEQNYINIVKYAKTIDELDKAKEIISTDSYLYYRYALIYKKQQEYELAIKYAKMGLEYKDKKSIYHKQYKFTSFNAKGKLNEIIGDCYVYLKEWDNAISAYSEAIKYVDYTYTSLYFDRGIIYYEIQNYNAAKQDFIKHKEKIEDCLQNEYCSIFKQKHLNNINLWIQACGGR